MGDHRDKDRNPRRARRLKLAPGHIRANDHLKGRKHRDKTKYHRPTQDKPTED